MIIKTLNEAAHYYFSKQDTPDQRQRQKRYENHIQDVLGAKSINYIFQDDLVYLIQTMKRKDLSAQYIDNMITMLKTIMIKAVKVDLTLKISPTLADVKRIYKSDQVNRTLSDDELEDLFVNAYKKSNQVGTIIKLLYYTAARPSGLLTIRAADVDFHNNTLTLPAMKGAGIYDQPMRKEAAALLKSHIELHNLKPNDHLFVIKETAHRQTIHMDYRQLAKRTDILFKKYNVNVPKGTDYNKKRLSLYSLRHTAITELVKVMSPAIVQKFVNHKSIETTQKYINITNKEIQNALDKL